MDGTVPLRVPKGYQTTTQRPTGFKPKTTHPHISKVEEPESSEGNRLIIHINQSLTEQEKVQFSRIMRDRYPEMFARAFWRSDLAVRIIVRGTNQELTDRKRDMKSSVNETLDAIFNART